MPFGAAAKWIFWRFVVMLNVPGASATRQNDGPTDGSEHDYILTVSNRSPTTRARRASSRPSARSAIAAVILGHHYQRADVYKHADLTGDSLRLSKLASQTEAEYIVFCGVHFMAEVADILSKPHQKAILPDLAAGCSMADMANLAKVERAWRELSRSARSGREGDARHLHQLGGRPEGVLRRARRHRLHVDQRACRSCSGRSRGARRCCSSPTSISAAGPAISWTSRSRRCWCGIPTSRWAASRRSRSRWRKILLWKGHCSVHQMFQAQHILRWRQQNPSGMVISHPECNFEVCKLSDYVGSTDFIIKTIAASAPGTRWLVGTELNLVNRIAEEFKPQGKVVQFMAPTVCMCSTMARIDPQHLAWSLENLVAGKVVNQIKVPAHEAELARIALDRMLAVS